VNSVKIEPYHHLTLGAGESGTVFEYYAGAGKGYINGLYCNWTADTYYIINFDGEPLETKTERQIGEITELEKYKPPIVFEHKMKVTAYNNSSAEVTFELLIDGEVFYK